MKSTVILAFLFLFGAHTWADDIDQVDAATSDVLADSTGRQTVAKEMTDKSKQAKKEIAEKKEELKQARKEAKAKRQSQAQQIQQAMVDIKKSDREASQLERENDRLRNELAQKDEVLQAAKQRQADSNEKLAGVKSEHDGLVAQMKDFENQKAQLHKEQDETDQKLRDARADLSRAQNDEKHLQYKLSAEQVVATKHAANTDAEMAKLRKDFQATKNRVDDMTAQLDRMHGRNEQLDTNLKTADSMAQDEHSKLKEVEKQVDGVKRDQGKVEASIQAKTDEIEQTKRDLQKAREEEHKENERLHELTDKEANHRTRAEAEINQIKDQMKASRARADYLRGEMEKLKESSRKLDDQVRTEEDIRDKMKSEVRSLESKVTDARDELEHKKRQVAAAH
jgi:chromosome segregation ATPase